MFILYTCVIGCQFSFQGCLPIVCHMSYLQHPIELLALDTAEGGICLVSRLIHSTSSIFHFTWCSVFVYFEAYVWCFVATWIVQLYCRV